MAGLPSATGPFATFEPDGDVVTCVRDHLGLAPLYATRSGSGWKVARTVPELAADVPGCVSDLDVDAVVGHIAGPYAPVPPRTFFAAVRQIVPGTVTWLGSDGVTEERWWHPAAVPVRPVGFDDAAAELRRLLVDVVADTVPPGPVAVTLSSGMDSSAVAAALVAAGREPVAVTWTTPQFPSADEGRWARMTAHHLRIPRVEVTVTADDLLDDVLAVRPDTPLVNPFRRIWQRTVARLAAAGVGVLVTGFSGDHLFGGRLAVAGDLAVAFRLAAAARLVAAAADGRRWRTVARSDLVGPVAARLFPSWWVRRRRPVPWLAPHLRERWRRLQAPPTGLGLAPARAERRRRLVDGMIAQIAEDTTVAADGVVLCHPLLDRRLVEFALGLPSWFLFDGSCTKAVLRAAFAADLPDEVVSLPNILPSAVAAAALRRRSGLLTDLTSGMEAARLGFVAEPALAEQVRRFLAGAHDDLSFWNALTLEAWLRDRR